MTGALLVLIVESDAERLTALATAIEAQGFDIVVAEDGATGLRQFFNSHPDVVVLSFDAKGVGWELVDRIRSLADTPIIATASEASVGLLQQGIEFRLDGFLVAPFAPEELVTRLMSIRERIDNAGRGEEEFFRLNGLVVNWRSCDVFVNGEAVDLTSTEFKLLRCLVQRRGWVLSHDQILTQVWGPEYVGEKDRVKLYIWYLRQKIEHDPKRPQLIVTKRGLGYKFVG